MTLKELSQLFYLNREIEMDRQRLEELYFTATNTTGVMSDKPRAAGVSDKVAKCAAEIADLSVIISAKQQQCIHERNRLERYIREIDDSLTRQIFTLRFVKGLSWLQVAAQIGGGNTDKNVSKLCYRYLGDAKK